jgi:hypothetical protein
MQKRPPRSLIKSPRWSIVTFAILLLALVATSSFADERHESFDRDPGWDSRNSRASVPEPQRVRQDFGYSPTRHCGGAADGEIGGFLTPAAEPAYYAREIPAATFNSRLTCSGKFACTSPHFHVLVGFFNSRTINEWRVPNSIVLRLYGRGDVFYAYVEYATSRWRAGGDSPGGFATVLDPETGRPQLKGFAGNGAVHDWSLTYDPDANEGRGSVTATIDGETAVCHLDPGHKADGATFDRCGLLNIPKSFDTGGEVWLDDFAANVVHASRVRSGGGRDTRAMREVDDFSRDPGWDAVGNRRTYMTTGVRPRFDFGFSDTQFAGGSARGELGGVVFRGDNRYPERLACCGDRLEPLTLDKPLRASGRVSLRRGVSDSTTLLGFFHSADSLAVSDSQSSGFPLNFCGVAMEGPSREGFLFYPAYRFPSGGDYARGDTLPHILPDGRSHAWSFEYDPAGAEGRGRIAVVFDGRRIELDLPAGHRDAGARFDRFGLVTTWVDGNAQEVYFDDLTYTFRQQ